MLETFVGDVREYEALPVHSGPAEVVRLSRVNCRFGPLLPNIGEWKAGDIVLSGVADGALFDPVATYQSLIYPDWDVHRWTHVGLYDGGGLIWDANPGRNIQSRSVTDFLLSKPAVKVVRIPGVDIDAPQLDEALRTMTTSTYDLVSLGLLLFDRLVKGGGGVQKNVDETVICSTFLERVYRRCGVEEVVPEHKVSIPADFADPRRSQTVSRGWGRLAA